MNETKPENQESAGSRKKLVRWLIILGIGIPVILELLTFFNLVKVQFWEEEKAPVREIPESVLAHRLEAGDTLFTGRQSVITIGEMRMDVNPRKWRFEMKLVSYDDSRYQTEVFIDSLLLNSGTVIRGGGLLEWELEAEDEKMEAEIEWEVPSGDIPRLLYLTLKEGFSPDSAKRINREVRLGRIPVRYRQSE